MAEYYDRLFDVVCGGGTAIKVKISGVNCDLREELIALTRPQLKGFLNYFNDSEEITSEDAKVILAELPVVKGRFHFRFSPATWGGHSAELNFLVYNNDQKVKSVFVGALPGKGRADLSIKGHDLFEKNRPLMKKLEGRSFATQAELLQFYNAIKKEHKNEKH